MEKTAREYLNQNYALHVDMIELLDRQLAYVETASSSGVLLKDHHNEMAFISALDPETYQSLLSSMGHVSLLIVHHEFACPWVEDCFVLDMTCYNQYYPFNTITLHKSAYSLKPLTTEHLDFVMTHYHHADHAYIESRLAAGVFTGAFQNNHCAGFIGTHEEQSMGMLVVLPDYRQQGIARHLLEHQIQKELQNHHRPFSQVVIDNIPSLKLHQSLGFVASATPVYWYHRK